MREAREGRRGFRLRTRRGGVRLKITVTAVEPVLVVVIVVYIVHVAFAIAAATAAVIAVLAVAAAGSYFPPLLAISMMLPRRSLEHRAEKV